MSFKTKILKIKYIYILYAGLAVYTGLQLFYEQNFNNYLIFTKCFDILRACDNLYEQHFPIFRDYYRYSPVFPVLMAPISLCAPLIGIIIWNLVNTLVLITGFAALFRNRSEVVVSLGLLFIFPEWLISTENCQSNSLIAGFILWGFYFLREQKINRSALMFCIPGYIKFYGVGAAVTFLLFKKKMKFMISSAVFILLLAILPLIFVSMQCLIFQYSEWFKTLVACKVVDQMSVMGILRSWFGLYIPLQLVSLIGLIITLAPLIFLIKRADESDKLKFLASVLIFLVIFNQMAESATYVIAVAGVAVWAMSHEKLEKADLILLALTLLFTSLSQSDAFPKYIRQHFFFPYSIKCLPCFLIWIKIQYTFAVKGFGGISKKENLSVL